MPSIPAIETVEPWAPVSEEPKPSKMMAPGSASRKARLSGTEKIAPPEPITFRLGMSYLPRASSSRSGRAKASPTIDSVTTFSRPIVRHTSAGSRERGSSWMQTVPPWCRMMNEAQWAAPCMNGGAGSVRRFSPAVRAFATSSSTLPTAAPPIRRPPIAPKKMSSCRQSTPLGMPVVPPVYRM